MHVSVYSLQYNVMRSLLIAPQTTYNEKHWEPHQNQAMAEAVGELAEFESKHDLNKLVSHTCSEIHTHITVIVCSLCTHVPQHVVLPAL